MARRVLALVLLSVAALTCAESAYAAPFEKSYAILIAIAKYQSPQWQKLDSATKDAAEVARILRAQGFEIIPLYDQAATKFRILSEMQNLARRLNPRDRVLVYFSGHGMTETIGHVDYGYLVPWDGSDNSVSYISMEELQEKSAKMGTAVHQLFLLDSCFGGLLTVKSGEGIDARTPNFVEEISRRPARQVLTAGGKDQSVVSNGPNGHSVFSGALLEAIGNGLADTNGDGYVIFSELVAYVTARASNPYQTPAQGVLPRHGLGEFLFQIGAPRPGSVKPIAVPFDPVLRNEDGDRATAAPPRRDVAFANTVREVLNDYRAAYENMSVASLQRVFPSFAGGDELQKKFGDMQGVAMALGNPAIQQTAGDTAVATCTYSLTYTSKSGRIEQTRPQRAEFRLRRLESGWIIEFVRFL